MNRLVALVAGGLLVASALAATQVASGASSSSQNAFVPIVPCRLMDTRAGGQIGPNQTLTAKSVTSVAGRGTQGQCVIPASATALAVNLTAVGGTAASFLTIWPDEQLRPNSSNLNWAPGAAVANTADVGLSSLGNFTVFNDSGTVDIIIDIAGYYETVVGGTGAVGPTGAAGASGAVGPAGAAGAPGAAGPVGPAGPAGTTGAAGPAGPTGADGPAGAAGPAGATGADGPVGAAGPAGATGADGPVGAAGPAGATGADGPVGAAGPAGATGAAGPAGPTGTFGAVNVVTAPLELVVAQNANGVVSCPVGQVAISGGAEAPTATALNIRSSRPNPITSTDPTGWYVDVRTGTNTTATVTLYVLCVQP